MAALHRLHLIRHAEYEGFSYAEPWLIGRSDPPLSAEGRRQAQAFAAANQDLAGLPVLASPARRAWETARLAVPTGEPTAVPLALEFDYGRLDGMSLDQACKLFPEYFRDPAALASLDYRSFGGETLADLAHRAKLLHDLLASYDEVVLVAHGLVLSALVQRLVPTEAVQVLPFGLCTRLSLELREHGNRVLI